MHQMIKLVLATVEKIVFRNLNIWHVTFVEAHDQLCEDLNDNEITKLKQGSCQSSENRLSHWCFCKPGICTFSICLPMHSINYLPQYRISNTWEFSNHLFLFLRYLFNNIEFLFKCSYWANLFKGKHPKSFKHSNWGVVANTCDIFYDHIMLLIHLCFSFKNDMGET